MVDTFNLTQSLECEQRIALIHHDQVTHGVYFDERRAHWYIHILNERLLNYYILIKKYLGWTVVSPNDYKETKPFKKDGTLTVATRNWYPTEDVGGPFCKVQFDPPETMLTKRARLGKYLVAHGWKPKVFTTTGIPKLMIDKEPCSSLVEFGELGDILSKYFTYTHRRNQIQGFFKHLWYNDKGECRISADGVLIGTPTFRMTHRVVANIPGGHAIFGREMRSLFSTPKGTMMVGSDFSGLEIRMLAHYINDPEYTDTVLNGDIHIVHQEMAGLPTRASAKEFIYALNYGAGVTKLGSIVGGGKKEGTAIKKKFLQANPKLSGLISNVTKQSESGFLHGPDGRRLIMRRDRGEVQTHKALNVLLQSAGSIVVRYAIVVINEWIKALELDATQVIYYHDECNFEVANKDVELMQRLLTHWATFTGEMLGIQCRLDSDTKVGRNWYDVH